MIQPQDSTLTPVRCLRHTAARTVYSRVLVAVSVITVLFLSLCPGGFSSSAYAAAPSSTTMLYPLNDGVVTDTGFSAVAVMHNTTDSAWHDLNLRLTITDTPLRTNDEITHWLTNGSQSNPPHKEIQSRIVSAINPGTSAVTRFDVAAETIDINERPNGVYGLAVDSDRGSARSVVTITGPEKPAATLFVPITATAITDGLLSAEQLSTLTAPNGELTAELDAVSGTPATLAIDPAIVAAIRVLGTQAPPSASTWLHRLEALPNERFALQFGDASISAQLQAGLSALLEPTSLLGYVDTSGSTAENQSQTSQTNQTPVPTLSELTTITGALGTIYWPATGSANAQAVSTLGADSKNTVLIPSDTTNFGSALGGIPAHAQAGNTSTAVYNSVLSATLHTASRQTDFAQRQATLAVASAQLWLAGEASAGQPILITVDRAQGRSEQALADTITAMSTQTQSETLSSLVQRAPGTVTITGGTADSPRVDLVHELLSSEAQIKQFATVLNQPELLTGRQRASDLQLLGNGWIGNDNWSAAIDEHSQATKDTLNAVAIEPSSDFTLLSPGANLSFWVRNTLPYAANATIIAAPNDLRLQIQKTTPITVTPDSRIRVEVPVTARIGSGVATVSVQLISPTGVHLGTTQTITVTVQADAEFIGLIVMIVAVVVFIGIGIIRMVLRKKKGASREKQS